MDCIDVPAAQRHSKTLVFLHGWAHAYIHIAALVRCAADADIRLGDTGSAWSQAFFK